MVVPEASSGSDADRISITDRAADTEPRHADRRHAADKGNDDVVRLPFTFRITGEAGRSRHGPRAFYFERAPIRSMTGASRSTFHANVNCSSGESGPDT